MGVQYFPGNFCAHYSDCASPVPGAGQSKNYKYDGAPRAAPNNSAANFDQLSKGFKCMPPESTVLTTSGRYDSLEGCLKDCLFNSECAGATYFGTNYCAHYSSCDSPVAGGGNTMETYRKKSGVVPPTTVSFTPLEATKCSPNDGVKLPYPASASHPSPTACMESCELNANCAGATYWLTGGYCA